MENMILFANRLKKGGRLYIATDHPEYGPYIEKELLGISHLYKRLPYTKEDRIIKTKWEKRQIAAGWSIFYFMLEKI